MKIVLVPVSSGRIQPATVRIVPEVCDQIPVLIAMRHHESGSVVHIALLDDESHDRVGGDGIEPRGRRIVQQEGRFGYHGPRNRGAPPHAAGKLARIFFERVFELDEPQ